MKKKRIMISTMLVLIMIVTGCGSGNRASKGVTVETGSSEKTEPTKETTESAEKTKTSSETEQTNDSKSKTTLAPTVVEPTPELTPEPTKAAVESPWKPLYECKYEFSVYEAEFYSKELAITVGYGGQIHYSNDCGETWPKAENSSMCRFGLDIVDENICYTCGNGGNVTKSTDGGKTFTKMTDFKNKGMIVDFLNESTGILVTSRSEMAVTKDGAVTWTEVTLPAKVVTAVMESEDVIKFIGNDFNLYTSSDCGATWTNKGLNLPEKEDYKKNQKAIAWNQQGDGSYTIYCIQDSTNEIKCYTTCDDFVTYTETAMPVLDFVPETLYVNDENNLLTAYLMGRKTICVLEKE